MIIRTFHRLAQSLTCLFGGPQASWFTSASVSITHPINHDLMRDT
jgi:hypothetical protein